MNDERELVAAIALRQTLERLIVVLPEEYDGTAAAEKLRLAAHDADLAVASLVNEADPAEPLGELYIRAGQIALT